MKNIVFITFIVLSLLLVNVQAAGNNLSLVNKLNYLYQNNNQDEINIMNQNMNKVSTQEMSKLGNYSELKLSQNRYNQTIISVQKQSKFLNLFQFKRSYEYSIDDTQLSYQRKWYDFMWGSD